MRYVCLVYLEEAMLGGLSASDKQALDRSSLAYDEELKGRGHLIVAHALEPIASATTIRVRDGRMSATDGPFAETKEVLGGFILIDARDLNEAIRIAANIPLAKLGSIEGRPTMEF